MFITKNALLFCVFLLSRSSRSAWIEIYCIARCMEYRIVALLAERVD